MFATTQLPSSASLGGFIEEAEMTLSLYSGFGYNNQKLEHLVK